MKEKISKNTIIGEIVKKNPELINVLLKHGMQCIGCCVATWETLEQAAASHGINIDELIKELNKSAG